MKKTKTIVTIFSLGSGVVFVALLAMILIRNRTFDSKVYYHTMTDTAKGLSNYPPIYFMGYSIGRVSGFKLTDKLKIKVDFYIYKEYRNLLYNYSLLQKNQNVLSGEIADFKLILPVEEHRNQIKEERGLVHEMSSNKGKEVIALGFTRDNSSGIPGIVSKFNNVLDQFVQQKTPQEITKSVTQMNEILKTTDETIASYHSSNSPEARRAIAQIALKTSDGLKNINETLTYIREVLHVIHENRNELSPMMMRANRTLDSARDTLEGINNHPFIRGGISKKQKEIKVETFD